MQPLSYCAYSQLARHSVTDPHFRTWQDITDRRERYRLALANAVLEALRAAEASAYETQQRHSTALGGIADVVLEVYMDSWSEESARACRLASANAAAYDDLFGGAPSCDTAGDWPRLCVDADQLVQLLVSVRKSVTQSRAVLRFMHPASDTHSTVRVSVTRMPDSERGKNLLVVCHNLTDFKKRVELEKDQEAVADIQHEEKGVHSAAEVAHACV